MKKIAVLGCTGSIGRQTLDVIRANPNEFSAYALCAGHDSNAVSALVNEFSPRFVGMADKAAADKLAGCGAKVISGENAACEIASLEQADIIVNGISGFAGMRPLLAALNAGKTVALANKESIVCAHGLVYEAMERGGGKIIPVDSEQSAIFQCLKAGVHAEVQRLILTASGGPFRTYTKEQLSAVTPEQAGRHPTWSMGRKITIDSASLFNKGLEIMEASYLFSVAGERISVLVHPESIVHSMVEFCDGSNVALMSVPDMRIAIQYALTYPARAQGSFGRLDLAKTAKLSFFEPDVEKFPAIPLAYMALKEGGALPIVYNGANEEAVAQFIQGKIRFVDIAGRVEYALMHAPKGDIRTEADVIETDRLARELVKERNKN